MGENIKQNVHGFVFICSEEERYVAFINCFAYRLSAAGGQLASVK